MRLFEEIYEIGDYINVVGLSYAPRKIVDIDISASPPVYTTYNGEYGKYSHDEVEYVTFDEEAS